MESFKRKSSVIFCPEEEETVLLELGSKFSANISSRCLKSTEKGLWSATE